MLRFKTIFSIGLSCVAAMAFTPAGSGFATAAVGESAVGITEQRPAVSDDRSADDGRFLRVNERPGRFVELQIATREYARADGEGPRVALVGVAHVGETGFYDRLQTLLDQYDLVLYESVLPPGAAGTGGETERDRIESTEAAMKFVGGLIKLYHETNGSYPESLDRLPEFARSLDHRIEGWLANALVDAWGDRLVYERLTDDDDQVKGFRLVSRAGADRDGDDAIERIIDAADLQLLDLSALFEESGIQQQLADALGLAFQLTAMDYSRPNWRVSDMSIDQVDRALRERGADFGVLGGALSGTSMTGRLISVVLRIIQLADQASGGAIADTMKVVMIEVLGDEQLALDSIAQMGSAFKEVIIDERNQVVMNDLRKIAENEPGIESVAIFYGAAHMPDFVKRLREQLGYEPTGEVTWLSAMHVDLARSAVSEAQLQRMRLMMRRAMQQQQRQRGR